MLVLTVVSVWLIAMGLVVGLSFVGVYFMYAALQNQTNDLALLAATILNEGDREGQMNNMVSFSRQLVFTSRKTYVRFADDLDFEPIAKQLLDEARDGAAAVEAERANLLRTATSEATNELASAFQKGMASQDKMTLPWIQTTSPRIVSVSFGYVDQVPSNVEPPKALTELAALDKQIIHTAQKDNYYVPNIDAKLSGPDTNLDFNLTSLAPPVQGTVSPAHMILPTAFKSDAPRHLPSVVTIGVTLDVATQFPTKAHETMKVIGCAATSGAQPPR